MLKACETRFPLISKSSGLFNVEIGHMEVTQSSFLVIYEQDMQGKTMVNSNSKWLVLCEPHMTSLLSWSLDHKKSLSLKVKSRTFEVGREEQKVERRGCSRYQHTRSTLLVYPCDYHPIAPLCANFPLSISLLWSKKARGRDRHYTRPALDDKPLTHEEK